MLERPRGWNKRRVRQRERDEKRARVRMRTRLWRRRQRNGQMMVLVETDAEIIDVLLQLRWLAEIKADDKGQIGVAIKRLLLDTARRLNAPKK